ncbi:MAG: hypothetical protein KDC54_22190, partial [Lewinella sp.]|nr:hypothetical protein [Lewinella sp.]
EEGLFRYIRHPMYASLLLLSWGILLKHPTLDGLVVSIASTIFLYLTAIHDERECIAYFGAPYEAYMRRTRRFIPFLW